MGSLQTQSKGGGISSVLAQYVNIVDAGLFFVSGNVEGALQEIGGNLETLESGKSDVGHIHDDRYYTESEADILLNAKSNNGHTHDDRYYTESEADTLLSGKSNVGHGHAISDVTNLSTELGNKEATANKNQAGGYVGLGMDSKIASSYLPAIAITETFVVTSQVDMLALTAQTGDVVVRTDLNKSYILAGTDPSILANWQELLTPTDTILSVNGQTGTVVLDTDDVSEGGTNQYFTQARARTSLSSSITGISYDNSKGIFSLTAGYVIPTTTQKDNWNSAYGWGNHALAGYLTSYTETDPIFVASQAHNITLTDITNLSNLSGVNTGDQDLSGYVTKAGSLTQITTRSHADLQNLGVDDHTQYGLLAGRSGGQTLVGGSAITDKLILQGTSGNGTLTSPSVVVNVGNNGASEAMSILNNKIINFGGRSQTTYNYDFYGNTRFSHRLYIGDSQTAAGLNTAVYVYLASGYRNALAANGSTGKLVYVAIGGTQGIEILTLNRSVDLTMLTTDANHGLTLNTTTLTSTGQHHLGIQTRFNGVGTYDAQNILLKDDASNSASSFLAMYLWNGSSYINKFKIRKDGLLITTQDIYINDTNKGLIQKSADGTCWKLSIDNSGVISASSLTCPA